MLFLLLDSYDKNEIKDWYRVCKRELKEADWKREYDIILCKVKKKDMKFYLDICMETGEKKTVLDDYPDEVILLYWRDINQLLRVSNNKNYGIAVDLLREVKKSMIRIKREQEWEQRFRELKEEHKRKFCF